MYKCMYIHIHSFVAGLILKTVTIGKATGKILRSGAEVLALVTVLKIAATATGSSNF